MPAANVWDRRAVTDDHAAESIKAYAAFIEYRDMGVQRSIRQLAQNLGKSDTLIMGWSTRHEWVARAEAWDAAQIAAMDELRAEQRKRLVERELVDYEKMLNRYDEVWEAAKLHIRHVKGIDPKTGKPTEVISLNVDNWHELTKWRDSIAKQGRRALGLPDKITESKTDLTSGGNPLTVIFSNVPNRDNPPD